MDKGSQALPGSAPPTDYDPVSRTYTPGFRPRRGRNWFFLGLLYAGYYLCRNNLTLVGDEIRKEFGWNNKQFGYVSSGRDFGYAIGQFVNGLFTDRLGGKQAMAIGAILTIAMNLIFGLTTKSGVAFLLGALVTIRTLDGYCQAFGAPGMVKINTSWFQRHERGKFAGIFGGMIQLGDMTINNLGGLLLTGFSIGFLGLHFAGYNWRIMFFVPPVILAVILILAWFNVANHPEQAGYSIPHSDDMHGGSVEENLPLSYVFKRIASTPLAWINAGAYFCTGFVRKATVAWWALYLARQWGSGKTSTEYKILAFTLPVSAFVGSFGSGLLSDTLFKGKRAPVAALLYTIETISILITIWLLGHSSMAGPMLACVLLTIISLTCNSTHSIIGTAAAMDLGGRKMAGFASGVIDSFQYFGSILAGFVLGDWIDQHGWNALFYSMAPFSAVGTLLMTYVWLTTRGRDVKGS
jgi:MFS transporter, OPA family, glycerol-3-phosphate transporter